MTLASDGGVCSRTGQMPDPSLIVRVTAEARARAMKGSKMRPYSSGTTSSAVPGKRAVVCTAGWRARAPSTTRSPGLPHAWRAPPNQPTYGSGKRKCRRSSCFAPFGVLSDGNGMTALRAAPPPAARHQGGSQVMDRFRGKSAVGRQESVLCRLARRCRIDGCVGHDSSGYR